MKKYNYTALLLIFACVSCQPKSPLFSGENAFDLRGLCSAFNIISSVDSPTMRMEIVIYDTIDLALKLNGNEYIRLSMKTDSSGDEELEIIQKAMPRVSLYLF